MNKNIAIITGATGGIGKEFVRELLHEDIDEIWAIARNESRLSHLRDEFGDKIIPISLDLTEPSSLITLKDKLSDNQSNIVFLVNNAGIAKMDKSESFDLEEIRTTILLNCAALASMSNLALPYMKKGSIIFNLSSASSFQPLPYLNLYASTKAFERSYSRALNVELKPRGISSIAVCPSWVDTELLSKELNGREFKFDGIVKADRVVKLAIKDGKKGKDMSVCSIYVNWLKYLSKVYPHKIIMAGWMRKMKPYL